jgi:hypothetical protein
MGKKLVPSRCLKTTFDAISNPFQGPGQAVSGLPKWRRNRKKEVTVNFLLLERIVPVPSKNKF